MTAKLKKVILKNFKSFRKAEIPINDGFTVIVGSNGSGKSNIMDAILFGLGTTSLKLLRASRLTELVNSGSVENYGKVELVIKHEDKTWNVSRLIDNKGRSVFRLNEERKSLNEIDSLLREMGIKNDGHNIVGQGDVTSIVEKSPVERREIIDDIAGLKEFDEKKKEAESELDKVEEKIKGTGIILAEREHHLEQLQMEREAALEYEKFKERKSRAKATILLAEIDSLKEQRDKIEGKINEIEGKKQEAEGKKAEFVAEEQKIRNEIEQINLEIISSSQSILSQIVSAMEEKKAQNRLVEERISSKNSLIQENENRELAAKEEIKALEAEKERVEKKIHEAGKEISRLEAEAGKIAGEMEKSGDEIRGGKTELISLEQELEGVRKKLELRQNEAFEKKAALQSAEHENRLAKQAIKEIEERLKELEIEIEHDAKKEAMLSALNSKYPAVFDEIKRTEEKISKTLEEEKHFEVSARHIDESIKTLEKTAANCPVCDSELPAKRKAELAERKNSEKKRLEFEKKEKEKIRMQLHAKALELKEWAEKKLRLEAELSNAVQKKDERRKLDERKKHLSASFKQNERLEIESAEKEKELSSVKEHRNRLEASVKSLRERIEAKSIHALIEKKAEIEKQADSFSQERRNAREIIIKRIEDDRKEILEEIEALRNANARIEGEIFEEKKKAKALEAEIEGFEKRLENAKKENEKKTGMKEEFAEKVKRSIERQSDFERKIRQLEKDENQLRIDASRAEVRTTDLEEEFKAFNEFKVLSNVGIEELKKEIPQIERKIEQLGAINLKAMQNFEELKAEIDDVKQKVGKLEEEKQAVMDLMEKIEVKRRTVFMDCFESIDSNFRKMFFNFFEGEGSLTLTDPEKPLESGLQIMAKHKGAALKNIDSLSGGEKTLTALAFLFALQLYNPAPFYIFDEADAALDKENSSRLAKISKEISKQSQFIAITHNDMMIKNADQIIGVALNDQKSSVIGLNLKEKLTEAKEQPA